MRKREKTCTYILKGGKRCQCYALKNDPQRLCYFHSALTKEQRSLASQKGGAVYKTDLRKDIEVRSAVDILKLLEEIINAVKAGKFDPRKANSVFYGANICLKTIELFKVQTRLEEISRQMEQQRKLGHGLPEDADSLDDIEYEPKRLSEE